MIKEERLYNGGKDSLFSNGVEKTGCLCAKESHWTILPPYKKKYAQYRLKASLKDLSHKTCRRKHRQYILLHWT